jgi:PPOX class probable F420-dependent enzyme
MTALPDTVKEWLDAATVATVGTISRDGSPQLSLVWVARDGDDVLISTTRRTAKSRNLERDPRVSVLIPNPQTPYEYVEVRGRARIDEDSGRELIDAMARKYQGKERFDNDGPDAVRVTIRVSPEHITGWS